jgi:hypothetical protein
MAANSYTTTNAYVTANRPTGVGKYEISVSGSGVAGGSSAVVTVTP